MKVLSLFDGISAGQEALKRTNIKIDEYYASEIDKYAQDVTRFNFNDTNFIGDVRNINLEKLPKIDLLIGGSPCQSFSFAGKMKGAVTKDNIEMTSLEQYLKYKKDGFEFEGQSYLFWEYVRILTGLKEKNPNIKFLLENVIMTKKWEDIISTALNVKPIEINSGLVSAQNRRRLYWTNIEGIIQPEDRHIYLKDIVDFFEKKFIKKEFKFKNDIEYSINVLKNNGFIENSKENLKNVDNKIVIGAAERGRYVDGKTIKFLELRKDNKSNCITTVSSTHYIAIYENNELKVRQTTTFECEKLQTFNEGYTMLGKDINGKIYQISNSQRYKMLGNSWTVDVVSQILSFYRERDLI